MQKQRAPWTAHFVVAAMIAAGACSEGSSDSDKPVLSGGTPIDSEPASSDGSSGGGGTSGGAGSGATEGSGGSGTGSSASGEASSGGSTGALTGGAGECGDGVVDAGEGCDDGNLDNNDECTAICQPAVCGDGQLHVGVEACDDGNQNDGDACTSSCTLPGCGDGHVDAGEECDDGNLEDDDACTSLCKKPGCGDGIVQAGEACDDGNQSDNDACLKSCQAAKCGDGVLHQGEELCDDGNLVNTDACLTTCEPAKCGDGFIHAGVEACDASPVPNGSCNGCSVACNAGYADCDKNAGNGCEASLASDKNNCGACGKKCGNGYSCISGLCAALYGPEHTFAGMTSNHYVTQGCCSVNCAGNQDVDAAYFCSRFYGANCTPQPGYAPAITPFPTYPKMHKFGGCSNIGAIIPNTTCDGGPCRITNLAENTQGLTNLVCLCK